MGLECNILNVYDDVFNVVDIGKMVQCESWLRIINIDINKSCDEFAFFFRYSKEGEINNSSIIVILGGFRGFKDISGFKSVHK